MTQSTQFLADDRETVEEAVAGDIIGLYDTGTYQIGIQLLVVRKHLTLKNYLSLHLNFSCV